MGSTGTNEEDNLNASTILTEALDTKEFYSVISKKNNVQKLLDFALPEKNDAEEDQNTSSQNSSLAVLTQLVSLYAEKRKEKEGKRKGSDDDDEETTVQQIGRAHV